MLDDQPKHTGQALEETFSNDKVQISSSDGIFEEEQRTSRNPASTSVNPSHTTANPVSTSMKSANTTVNPSCTAVNPASTTANPASTAVKPTSTGDENFNSSTATWSKRLQCESCGGPHDGTYGSARFCSSTCAKKVGAKIKWGLASISATSKAVAPNRNPFSSSSSVDTSAHQSKSSDKTLSGSLKDLDEPSLTTLDGGVTSVAAGDVSKGPRICEGCGKQHDGSYGSGRYCACSCARRKAAARKWEKQRRQEVDRKPNSSVNDDTSIPTLPQAHGSQIKRRRTQEKSPDTIKSAHVSPEVQLGDILTENSSSKNIDSQKSASPIAVAPVPLRPVPQYYSNTAFPAFGPLQMSPMPTYFHPLQCNPYTAIRTPYAPFTAPSPGFGATPPPPPPPTPAPLLTGVNAQGQPQVVSPVHLFAPQAQVSSRKECESVAEALLCLSAPSPAPVPSPVPIAKASVKTSPIVSSTNMPLESNTTSL